MDMDTAAIIDSEVMMSFLTRELQKEAACQPPQVDGDKVVRDFRNFQDAVKGDPKLRFTFKKLQEKFSADPEYTSKVDPKFVEGVMLLDLEDKQE